MAKPVKTFKSSGGLSVYVWKNISIVDGMPKEFHTVSFSRGYKDQQGAWASTTNLREQDLPKLKCLLQQAYEFLVIKETI